MDVATPAGLPAFAVDGDPCKQLRRVAGLDSLGGAFCGEVPERGAGGTSWRSFPGRLRTGWGSPSSRPATASRRPFLRRGRGAAGAGRRGQRDLFAFAASTAWAGPCSRELSAGAGQRIAPRIIRARGAAETTSSTALSGARLVPGAWE